MIVNPFCHFLRFLQTFSATFLHSAHISSHIFTFLPPLRHFSTAFSTPFSTAPPLPPLSPPSTPPYTPSLPSLSVPPLRLFIFLYTCLLNI